MGRGPKKHLKRINAPSHWMLDKLTGRYAPKASPGPHKSRECLPLLVLLRNRLKYALTYDEVKLIVKQRLVKVDGKVRTDMTYPTGFMDVVSLDRTNEKFRMLYDTKGRFCPHKITDEEATYKLCRVKKTFLGPKEVNLAVTHDGRTFRCVHPEVKAGDSLRVEVATGKILEYLKFEPGNLVMVTGGHNVGRVGTVVSKEKHPGSFDLVHVRDSNDSTFTTRSSNVFVIGVGTKSYVSLPAERGIRKTIIEQRNLRLAKSAH
ncbi:40S ribosomal protein S4 [Theileria orientalis strain Shintoku]|uniref:40S ribosomal protein S4 n=1 Tax=Theileria orientalis strain Shintoku TaxID=869250 RepID=J4CDX0_THEOR|nr:40S ribosomal protein S4 [Theileria orientalis strain Shintoku]PVC52889.1 40S ribosomal protein S4 [Theileria orientalis]BAM41877.1 40S ribosomal protein S4 [Theileria orientalis strain Shintoku]|eukprot:XP_009692178.1 40S ribosomal protein S4 [Theileria orientalis strain Shintoku]